MQATSGQAQLAWEQTDAAPGGDVLLIHAGVTDRRGWAHVLDRLRASHRCVSYDARGFGETAYEPEPGWSPVDDAVAVLDAAGCERACVVAASMGGRVALDLTLAHPDRVTGLVLIGSGVSGAPSGEPPSGATAALMTRIQAAEAAVDLEELNRLEAWLWLDGAAARGRVGGPARALFDEMNGRALRAVGPGPPADAPAAWPRLEEIAAPSLVLVGELDLPRLQRVGEALAARLPVASLVRLPGVAHLPHLEGDPTTLREIAGFVDRLDRLDRLDRPDARA